MFIKGLITTAVVGLALPVFAVGVVGGVMLANEQKRKPGCRNCCMICNGSCKTVDSNDSYYKKSDLHSEESQS
jgi:hypothetical protein